MIAEPATHSASFMMGNHNDSRGFTIIELLVSMAIVSILAAIAMTRFYAYKENAYNAVARSDLKAGITAEEAYYVDNNAYADCLDPASCEALLPGFKASRADGDIALSSFVFTNNGESFTAQAQHSKSPLLLSFDSNVGVIIP